MANEKHLNILRQGVEVWNQWRKDNYQTKPDLSRSDLDQANLNWVNLSGVNLSGADLSGANLSGASLSGASLSGANLSGVDLSGANLYKANLEGIDLSGKDFTGANFAEQDLSGKDLTRANLQNANLQTSRLINANLDGANLTDAHLWETQRAGWSIKGVICESIYWDKDGKEKTVYASGEFERLFADQTKIKLFYKDGITPLEIATLPALIQHLEDVKGCALRFVSITEGAGGAVVELAIEDTEDLTTEKIEALKYSIKESAERDIQILRSALKDRDNEVKLLTGKVEGFKESIAVILRERQGDTINISGGQIGAVGHNAHTHDSNLNQIVNAENSSVETQIQGEGNIAVDGDSSDSKIITGNKNKAK